MPGRRRGSKIGRSPRGHRPAAGDTGIDRSGNSGVWRYGDCELDERVATLRVGTAAVELDRSSYDVLLALLRHAGEVVTKDELLEAGWPGRVVSENSLAKAVSRLRHALGPDGEAIRAVHGYGYRLAAAVAFHAVALEQVEAHIPLKLCACAKATACRTVPAGAWCAGWARAARV